MRGERLALKDGLQKKLGGFGWEITDLEGKNFRTILIR